MPVTNILLTILNKFFNNSGENKEEGHPENNLNAALNEENDVPLIKLVKSSSKNAVLFKPQMHISDDKDPDLEVCFVIISLQKLTKLCLICSPVKLH